MWDLVQPGPLQHLGGAERIAGLVCWRGPLTGCSAWAAHTPSPVQATQELVPIPGAPPGSEDTHFTPSTSGKHWTWALMLGLGAGGGRNLLIT